jgi:hypothetical protein|tara:strand:+ start:271 stop:597 length:327 start_codon:yes stop_codon:yes gene_type:complete
MLFFCLSCEKKNETFGKERSKRTAHITAQVDFKKKKKNNGEKDVRRAEEEEEEGERRGREGSCCGNGEVEARTDADLDGIGVASQGYFCIACASEIERYRSVFLSEGE